VTAAISRIRRLAPAVADAIAAGEVVERPASVIKELCENSLDAGGHRIDVEIEGGGLVRAAVVDDGEGIAADDLPLAVSRHATSKIQSHHDLTRISTLGFRGEALASIAAVSDLRLTSCVAGATGATIRVRSGEIVETHAAGAAVGTCVEVLELFATTPARLRFLRDSRTETAHASRMVADLALAHPDVAFTCTSDGRQTIRTAGASRRDAMCSVFGAEATSQLVEVSGDGPVTVQGLITPPLVHRGTRAGIVVVVNGRRVHNRSLVVAIEDAYHGLLPQHRHPFGLIAVTLDPDGVDVNVHPTKREVRFRDERTVFAAVQRACWSALQLQPRSAASRPVAPFATWDSTTAAGSISVADGDHAILAGRVGPARASGMSDPLVRPAPQALRAVGQVRGEWIVAEGLDGVVLVDPHAAHEKILYTQLLDEWSQPQPTSRTSQLLLLPVLVECDPAQMARALNNAAFLEACGFEVEQFGEGVLRCAAVPAAAVQADAARLLRDILDSLDDDAPTRDRRHRVAALVACHSAVRFGDRLDPDAQQHLLDRLGSTPGGSTCPHGRPTTLALEDAELRRAFRRSPR